MAATVSKSPSTETNGHTHSLGPFAQSSFIYFGVGQTSSMSTSNYGNPSNQKISSV